MSTSYSIKQLTGKYRDGSLSPYDHICNELNKLYSINSNINPIAQLIARDVVLKQATESTNRYKNGCPLGPFDGVPVTVKDSILCELIGRKTEMGSMLSNLDKEGGLFGIAQQTSQQISMLIQNGAIILCITTCPELGHKAYTTSFEKGITRNPHNLLLSTGGSSGGSAALTTLNIGNLSIGTDGGGSVRIPSAWCGVNGFKPSYNIGCCNHPMWPYIGVAGPMSLHIDDIRVYMEQLCKVKNLNEYDVINKNMDWSEDYMKKGVKGLNIAISKNYDGIIDFVDDRIWNKMLKFGDYLISLGANVTFIEPPLSQIKQLFGDDKDYYQSFSVLWYSFMGLYGEYMQKFKGLEYMVDPGIIDIINRSKTMSMKDLVLSEQIRDKVIEIMVTFHKEYDLLITPTTATLPLNAMSYKDDLFMVDKVTNKTVKWFDCYHNPAMFTCLENLTYQPAISINIGFEKDEYGKIPIGAQIIGRNNEDNLVVRAAYSLQKQYKPLIAKL